MCDRPPQSSLYQFVTPASSSLTATALRYVSTSPQHQQIEPKTNSPETDSLPNNVFEMNSNKSFHGNHCSSNNINGVLPLNSTVICNDSVISNSIKNQSTLSEIPLIFNPSVQRRDTAPIRTNLQPTDQVVQHGISTFPQFTTPSVIHQHPRGSPNRFNSNPVPFSASNLTTRKMLPLGQQMNSPLPPSESKVFSLNKQLEIGLPADDQEISRRRDSASSLRWRSLSLFVKEVWDLFSPEPSKSLRPFCKIKFTSFTLQTIPAYESPTKLDTPHQLGWVVKFPIPSTKGMNPSGIISIEIFDSNVGPETLLGHAEFDIASVQAVNDWRFDGVVNVIPAGFLKVEVELSSQPVGTPSLQRPPLTTNSTTIGVRTVLGRQIFGHQSDIVSSESSPSTSYKISSGRNSESLGHALYPSIIRRAQSIGNVKSIGLPSRTISATTEGTSMKAAFSDHRQYQCSSASTSLLNPANPLLHGNTESFLDDIQQHQNSQIPLKFRSLTTQSNPCFISPLINTSSVTSASYPKNPSTPTLNEFTSSTERCPNITKFQSYPRRSQTQPLKNPKIPNTEYRIHNPLFNDPTLNTSLSPSSFIDLSFRSPKHSISSLTVTTPALPKTFTRGLYTAHEGPRIVGQTNRQNSIASLSHQQTTVEGHMNRSSYLPALLSPFEWIHRESSFDDLPEAFWNHCVPIDHPWDNGNESSSQSLQESRCLADIVSQLPSSCPIIRTVRLILHSVHLNPSGSSNALLTVHGRILLDQSFRLSFKSLTGTITENESQITRYFPLESIVVIPYGFEQNLQLQFQLHSSVSIFGTSINIWEVLRQEQRQITGRLPLFEEVKCDDRSDHQEELGQRRGYVLLEIELMNEYSPASIISKTELDPKATGCPKLPECLTPIQHSILSTPELNSPGQQMNSNRSIRIILTAEQISTQRDEILPLDSFMTKVSLGTTIALKGRLEVGGRPLEFIFPYSYEQTLKLAALPENGINSLNGGKKSSKYYLGTLRLNLLEALKNFCSPEIISNNDRHVNNLLRCGQQLQVTSPTTGMPFCAVICDLSFSTSRSEKPYVRTLESIRMNLQNEIYNKIEQSLEQSIQDSSKIIGTINHHQTDKFLDRQMSHSSRYHLPILNQQQLTNSLSSSFSIQQTELDLKNKQIQSEDNSKIFSSVSLYIESAQVYVPVDNSIEVPLKNVLLTSLSIGEASLDGIPLITELDLYASVRFENLTVKTKAIKKTHCPRLHTLCIFPYSLNVADSEDSNKILKTLLSYLSIHFVDRGRTPDFYQRIPSAVTSSNFINEIFRNQTYSYGRCKCIISNTDKFLEGKIVVVIMPLFCAQNESKQIGEVRILVQLTNDNEHHCALPSAIRLNQVDRLPFTTILKDFIKQQTHLERPLNQNIAFSTSAGITPRHSKLLSQLVTRQKPDFPSELEFSQCKSIGLAMSWDKGDLPEHIQFLYFKLTHGSSSLKSPIADLLATNSIDENSNEETLRSKILQNVENDSNPYLLAKLPFDQTSIILFELVDRKLPCDEQTIGMAAVDPKHFTSLHNSSNSQNGSVQEGIGQMADIDAEERQILSYRTQLGASTIGNKFGVPTWSAEFLLPLIAPEEFNSTTTKQSSLEDAKCCLRVRIDLLKSITVQHAIFLPSEIKSLSTSFE